jgi:hypothetical protein
MYAPGLHIKPPLLLQQHVPLYGSIKTAANVVGQGIDLRTAKFVQASFVT